MLSLEREFLFTSGKGGVGKTTVAVALARALAGHGRRVLLGLLDGGLGARLLGKDELSSERIEPCGDGLWATLLEPEAALAEYGTMVLRSKAAYRALFQNRYAKSFLAAVPGLHQWAVLGKAWFHSQERAEDGTKRWDTVVLDAPATGHGLEMLRVPRLITEIAPKGLLRRDAELAWQTFTDPARAGIVVVALPEALAVSETLELISELESLHLPIATLAVNALHQRTFEPRDIEALEQARTRLGEPPSELLTLALDRARCEVNEAREVERLRRAMTHHIVELPWIEDAASRVGCQRLVESMLEAIRGTRA